ncbi:CLUMA_CG003191, isoform A [Clunio marinus]|uniref:CLUMA_CG003191, isoform A n=1 Tax=Clunio marinus TaxID=568069 RepID=A0A1J1HSJ1_9DIPT|nr:CLUMA_CG003191, isoform A [Clunio marinus]
MNEVISFTQTKPFPSFQDLGMKPYRIPIRQLCTYTQSSKAHSMFHDKMEKKRRKLPTFLMLPAALKQSFASKCKKYLTELSFELLQPFSTVANLHELSWHKLNLRQQRDLKSIKALNLGKCLGKDIELKCMLK